MNHLPVLAYKAGGNSHYDLIWIIRMRADLPNSTELTGTHIEGYIVIETKARAGI